MPVPGSPEPSARAVASPSRSSNAMTARKASPCCRDAGSSSAHWPGSPVLEQVQGLQIGPEAGHHADHQEGAAQAIRHRGGHRPSEVRRQAGAQLPQGPRRRSDQRYPRRRRLQLPPGPQVAQASLCLDHGSPWPPPAITPTASMGLNLTQGVFHGRLFQGIPRRIFSFGREISRLSRDAKSSPARPRSQSEI